MVIIDIRCDKPVKRATQKTRLIIIQYEVNQAQRKYIILGNRYRSF